MATKSMRATWKGAVSFGLVTIPVGLFKATEDAAVTFNQLHRADGGRITYKKFCSDCGNEVAADEIVKGFDVGGDYVLMEDADFKDLPLASKKVVQIDRFIDRDVVDPVYLTGKHYVVAPEEAGARGFGILTGAMEQAEVWALGTIAMREQKEHLVVLRPGRDGLMMDMLHRETEIREVDTPAVPQPADAELDMALQLVESMHGDFNPAERPDRYREMLMGRIEAKAAGLPVPEAPSKANEAKVGDLMAALKASVAGSKPKKAAPKKKAATSKRRAS